MGNLHLVSSTRNVSVHADFGRGRELRKRRGRITAATFPEAILALNTACAHTNAQASLFCGDWNSADPVFRNTAWLQGSAWIRDERSVLVWKTRECSVLPLAIDLHLDDFRSDVHFPVGGWLDLAAPGQTNPLPATRL
ncbi:MAG: hypothetical protein GY772_12115 [bacterium]|nr:hypothetical protein [bacterium]